MLSFVIYVGLKVVSIAGKKYIPPNILLFIFKSILNFPIKMNKTVNYKSNEILVIVNHHVSQVEQPKNP